MTLQCSGERNTTVEKCLLLCSLCNSSLDSKFTNYLVWRLGEPSSGHLFPKFKDKNNTEEFIQLVLPCAASVLNKTNKLLLLSFPQPFWLAYLKRSELWAPNSHVSWYFSFWIHKFGGFFKVLKGKSIQQRFNGAK